MINYPNISNPQIDEFTFEQPTNNQSSTKVAYNLQGRVDVSKPRVANTTFIFNKGEFETFMLWYTVDLQKGLKSFQTDWKDFGEVFFTEGSKLEYVKLGDDGYKITGLVIETLNNFKGY